MDLPCRLEFSSDNKEEVSIWSSLFESKSSITALLSNSKDNICFGLGGGSGFDLGLRRLFDLCACIHDVVEKVSGALSICLFLH